MSAPAAEPEALLKRTDRREAELHQVSAGNREHWEGRWCDRTGERVGKHASFAMRELQGEGLVELVPGPMPEHFYVRLTHSGSSALYAWTRTRRGRP